MASWSSRRKTKIAIWVIIALIVFIAVPSFLIFYKAPTCFDGKKNGSELDVDCGGACTRLCQSAFLPPRIEWGGAKIEKLTDGLYNASSYIVNPNVNGSAINVPYKISLYDSEGLLIVERKGTVTLYAHRNSLAFQTAINTGQRIPVKATFEFLSAPMWFKSADQLGGIAILDKKYQENNQKNNSGSSLEVTLENKTLYPYQNVLVGVVLYDIGGNVIGFSQTKIDSIGAKNGREVAPFTWSHGREAKVTSIEVMPIIYPVLIK